MAARATARASPKQTPFPRTLWSIRCFPDSLRDEHPMRTRVSAGTMDLIVVADFEHHERARLAQHVKLAP